LDFYQIVLLVPSILLALTLHELAHGYVADLLGDPTPRNMGRLSLNPLKHLDPVGTIMLFVLHFGWAKPVIVDPRNFAHPKRDMLLVALAGPGSNVLQAVLFALILRWLQSGGQAVVPLVGALQEFAFLGLLINISLAVFNLIPIPPLDGSRIIYALVPARYDRAYRKIERFGALALLTVVLLGMVTGISPIGAVLLPTVNFFLRLFIGV